MNIRKLLIIPLLFPICAQAAQKPFVFGNKGQVKMLYDLRQRPQAVYLNKKLHIVFNADGKMKPGNKKKKKGKPETRPKAITYDTLTRKFSKEVTLGPSNTDHHYGPVIWADLDGFLHVLHGCHRTPGKHMISRKPGSIGTSRDSWDKGPSIAPSISYPSVHRIYDKKTLIYFRALGHPGSWTYRISKDRGRSWTRPEKDVTDLDINGAIEMSAYHSVLPSRDGKFLHAAFITYDDNKPKTPERFYNPRYKTMIDLDFKYNLYYIKIDLETEKVFNHRGEQLKTPIDNDLANSRCMIWDTKWRGSGVPPAICLDKKGEPGFLHVISGESLKQYQYYYVKKEKGKWKQTPVTRTSHPWNSTYLSMDKKGKLHAFLITGRHNDSGRYKDSYGGGNIEEWISSDSGKTWRRFRDVTPDKAAFQGWKYNNVQPIKRPDGSIVDNMLLFYGWGPEDGPTTRAFLLHE